MASSVLALHGRSSRLASPVVFLPGLCCTSRLWAAQLSALVDLPEPSTPAQRLFNTSPEIFSADTHFEPALGELASNPPLLVISGQVLSFLGPF